MPRKSTAIPAAIAQAETGRRRGAAIINAPAAGHSATHSRQPVHSADRMFTSLSTGSADGHALAHLPQSMHKASSRRMRSGLASAASPIKAPYGHRERHQKFCTNTEATTNSATTIPPPRPRKRKKLSIFTSSTMPYGPSKNARIAGTDMEPTAYRNKASSRYFKLRNPRSNLRGRRKLRPKVWRPSRHRYSDTAPTGHSQPQKLLRKIQETARKAISRNIPAG